MSIDYQSEVLKICGEIKSGAGRQAKRLDEVESKLSALQRLSDELAMAADRPGKPESAGLSTPGQRITGDSDLVAGLSDLNRAAARKIVKFDGGLFRPLQQATVIDSSAVGSSTPGILTPQRVAYVTGARRRLTLRDLLPVRTTDSNSVEYPKEDAFTNAASPQTEGSAKSESALTFTITSAPVRTYAHWIPASRQVLDDWPELARIIDNTLIYGLLLKEEEEILSGDGTGQHLDGLISQASAFDTDRINSNDTKLDYLRHAISQLQEADEMADFVVLNPSDFWAIRGLKDSEDNIGAFIAGDPLGGRMDVVTLWGLSVVVTNSIDSGEFLVGNTAQATIFDRMQAVVEISTEHSDYFVKNLVAIRAEERLAFAIYRASAFLTGSFSGSSPA